MTLPEPYYDRDGITIFLGDCRDILPHLSLLPKSLFVTDPPYGINYATNHKVNGKGASWINTQIQGDGSTALRDWVIEFANGQPMFVFGHWKVQRPQNVRTMLVWDKGPAFGMGDLSLPWKGSWEEIYVIGQGFIGSRDEGVLKGFTNVSWESKGRRHPNEKPVSLLRYLIDKTNWYIPVIDPFMGSGTTLRAAKDLGRRAIGIEIEPKYCDIAIQRLQQSVLPLEVS